MLLFLRALPLLWQLAIGAAVVAAIGGAYLGWHHHVYNNGYTAAIHAVAAKDDAAMERVRLGAKTVAACRNSNGTWDVVSGQCLKQ